MIEISTRNMTHEQWIAARRRAIGGSDAAAIVGLNPFCTAYEVWASKMGLLPEKPENEAMRIGHDLEDYVAHRFEEATGKRVRRKNAMLCNPAHPYAHANVDRLIVGERAGLECKTTSPLMQKQFKDGGYPAHYYVQCQHYMMVTGLPVWYLAVLILGRDFLWFEIRRNDDDIRALSEAERQFWQYVEQKQEPPADGSASCTEILGQLYNRAEPESVTDLTLLRKAVQERQQLAAQIKELQALAAEQDNRIKQFMGESETGICEGFTVTWRNASRTGIDTKRLKAERPDIFQAYQKTTTYRTFSAQEDKEEA